jgi:hypothetical protein
MDKSETPGILNFFVVTSCPLSPTQATTGRYKETGEPNSHPHILGL